MIDRIDERAVRFAQDQRATIPVQVKRHPEMRLCLAHRVEKRLQVLGD